MPAKSDTEKFIEELQAFAGRPLNFPTDLGQILDLVRPRGMATVFRDVIFHAKFAVKTKDIMARIGEKGEGYGKLSTEFQNSVEKTSALLKTIVKESPQDVKQHFVGRFFGLDPESFGNLIRLMEDLSWVKNWEVDGRALPFGVDPGEKDDQSRNGEDPDNRATNQFREISVRIRNGATLGCVLMIFMFFVDPPITAFGWSLAIVVTLLLLSITLMSRALIKTSR